MLDGEAAALGNAPFGIGQISIACALGYLDYRFDDFGWRAKAPALAAWFATVSQRPSFAATEPADG
jgi:glutathione S-transferase